MAIIFKLFATNGRVIGHCQAVLCDLDETMQQEKLEPRVFRHVLAHSVVFETVDCRSAWLLGQAMEK
jgi:hypothetical protein